MSKHDDGDDEAGHQIALPPATAPWEKDSGKERLRSYVRVAASSSVVTAAELERLRELAGRFAVSLVDLDRMVEEETAAVREKLLPTPPPAAPTMTWTKPQTSGPTSMGALSKNALRGLSLFISLGLVTAFLWRSLPSSMKSSSPSASGGDPDLIVTRVRYEARRFCIEYANVGFGGSKVRFELLVRTGDAEHRTQRVPVPQPGREGRACAGNPRPYHGRETLTVEADWNHRVREVNEGNNTSTRTLLLPEAPR